jgi:hypothetical protein
LPVQPWSASITQREDGFAGGRMRKSHPLINISYGSLIVGLFDDQINDPKEQQDGNQREHPKCQAYKARHGSRLTVNQIN